MKGETESKKRKAPNVTNPRANGDRIGLGDADPALGKLPTGADVEGGDLGSAIPTPLGERFSENILVLSAGRQRLLRQILDESNETFFLSSREMGRRYNVDSATIIRTVQALGYEKFADFAQDLREHFVSQITPYSAMKAAEQTSRSVSDRVLQSVDQDLENLNALRAGLDANRVAEIAKQINHARRIVVIGIDFAASLAGSLAYALVRLGFDAEAPIGSSGVVQNKVNVMTPKDLLIAISFGRGLRDTIDAVLTARRRHVPSVGLTDGDATPIARYCDTYIKASIARTSFIDSYAAPTAVINALLVACAHSQSARALEHLRESEEEITSGARWYRDSKAPITKRS